MIFLCFMYLIFLLFCSICRNCLLPASICLLICRFLRKLLKVKFGNLCDVVHFTIMWCLYIIYLQCCRADAFLLKLVKKTQAPATTYSYNLVLVSCLESGDFLFIIIINLILIKTGAYICVGVWEKGGKEAN